MHFKHDYTLRPLRKVENYTDLLNFSNLVNLNSLIIKRIKFIKSLRFSKLGFSEWPLLSFLFHALCLIFMALFQSQLNGTNWDQPLWRNQILMNLDIV